MKHVAVVAVMLCSPLAWAQSDYPVKPIRIVIGTPAGLSKALAERVQGEIRRALTAPAMKAKLAHDGVDAIASSPAELDAFMRADIEKWRKVIQVAKIRNE